MAQADTERSVTHTFAVRHSSDDCAVRSERPETRCLDSNVRVDPRSIHVEHKSANCGSMVRNLGVISDRPNCVALSVYLRGCGYDKFLGLKNCKGRGWVDALVTLRESTR